MALSEFHNLCLLLQLQLRTLVKRISELLAQTFDLSEVVILLLDITVQLRYFIIKRCVEPICLLHL